MDVIQVDSDCENQENEISAITIPDSIDVDTETDANEVNSAGSEDGEVEDIEVQTAAEVSGSEAKETIEDDGEELFTVNFQSKQVFHQMGHTILNALQTALNTDEHDSVRIVCTSTEYGMSLKAFKGSSPSQEDLDASADQSNTIEETSCATFEANRSEKEQSPDLTGLSSLFMIDTEPAKKKDTIKVPSYKRAVKDALDEEVLKKRKKDSTECKRTAHCFNCGSTDHSMRDCDKPRNSKRIFRSKKAHSSKTERYHADIEQRFAHLQPGVISDKLQTALNLRPGELPFFFYRMRVLGYPPGWLEDAKVANSGMMLFNSEGNAVSKADEDTGEIDELDHRYDTSKIVGFPGFNVDPGKKFYDDYKHHNVPPLNKKQSKEEFIKTLGDNIVKGYKRKKMLDPQGASASGANDETKLEVADMEIEDAELQPNVEFSRPMPPAEPQSPKVPPPPPPPPIPPIAADESMVNATSGRRTESPTLEDLEARQRKLLQELELNISALTENTDDSLIDDVIELETTEESILELGSPERNQEETAETVTPTTSRDSLEATNKASVIKESHMGTPLIKFSPYDKLPAGDNFRVGVSDVINFENLPDSTGKYEQMKVVIQKVRNTITKLNSENDC